jgi:hypothetical protein
MLLTKSELNLAKLCPKEESRYTLRGIAVNPQHTVVTDGSFLIAVTHHSGMQESAYPVLGLAALSEDKQLFVNSLDSIQSFKSDLTGMFPCYQAVIPTEKPIAEVALDARYLESLAKYVREHGDDRVPVLRLTLYGSDKAIRIDARTPDSQDILALLMPVRASASDFAVRPSDTKQEKAA